MSHVVSITTEFRDEEVLKKSCEILGLETPVVREHELFSGRCHGLGIQLPGWKYKVVVDTKTGTVKYDNYNGHWGKIEEFNRLKQRYAAEKVKASASKLKHHVKETMVDNKIKLTIKV